MIITNLHLRNFRNHADRTVVFTKGVNAVIGENGTGKTRIMEAICFLLFGEGYKPKSELLKIGEISGFVEGDVLFSDGKTANIWRSIEDSKVKLTYDGKTYVKAGEVKALWQTLFNLDVNVFKNVNMASQNDIPALFSGDATTRRNVFQKIFMVPATAKIRDSIWNDYMKKAPPELFVLSELEKTNITIQKETLEGTMRALKHEISNIEIFDLLSEDDVKNVNETVIKARQAQVDRQRRGDFMIALAKAKSDAESEGAALRSIEAELVGAPDLITLQNMDRDLSVIKLTADRMRDAKVKYDAAVEQFAPWLSYNVDAEEAFIADARRELDSSTVAYMEAKSTLKALHSQRDKLLNLHNHPECPTCGQALKDTRALVADLDKQIHAAGTNEHFHKEGVDALSKQIKTAENGVTTYRRLKAAVDQALSNICDVEVYDAENHEMVKQAITKLRELTERKEKVQANLYRWNASISAIEKNIQTLTLWTNIESPDDVIQSCTLRLAENENNKAKIQIKKAETMRQQFELDKLVDQLKTSEVNKEQNDKRKAYIDSLQKIYDVLHPSQFAAKLIQSYSTTLEEKLTKYLSLFNFRYTVNVSDAFDLEVFNDEGMRLPDVSGGEKMVIGLSLRLALHDIFSQSLSMLLIDEPSQNLDKKKQSMLFDVVEGLKNSGIDQIIIIDHNEELARVVDNTVTLQE